MPRAAMSLAGAAEMSLPSSRIAPAVGFRAPEIMFSIVVLPEPFGPISPSTSFFASSNDILSTATRPPKRLVTRSTRNAAVPGDASDIVRLPALKQTLHKIPPADASPHEVFEQPDHAARNEIDDEEKAYAQQHRGLRGEFG